MAKYIDADALMEYLQEIKKQAEADNKTRFNSPLESTIDVINSTIMMKTDEIMRIVEEMPAADVEPVSRWISVDERLPEYEGSYLVCTAKSGAFIGHYYARSKSFNEANGHITHWMNRPEPPKMNGGSEE